MRARGAMDRVRSLGFWSGEEVVVQACGDVKEELGLGEGRTNQNFIVSRPDGSRLFVRVGKDLPFFRVSRVREAAASRAADVAGLGPAVRHTKPPDILVTEFVTNGRALTEDDLHGAASEGPGSALLATVTSAFRRLHALPVPEELAEFTREAGDMASGWGGPHMALWLAYAEEQCYARLPLLSGLRDIVARLEADAGERAPARFCHFDLLADNLVLRADDQAILLVDFEYAAAGQPLMDLAVLAMGCSLSDDQERNLLSSYLTEPATEAQLRSFQAVRVMAALRETLWGVTAELSGSSALSEEEASAYADMNYAKFTQSLAEYDAARA